MRRWAMLLLTVFATTSRANAQNESASSASAAMSAASGAINAISTASKMTWSQASASLVTASRVTESDPALSHVTQSGTVEPIDADTSKARESDSAASHITWSDFRASASSISHGTYEPVSADILTMVVAPSTVPSAPASINLGNWSAEKMRPGMEVTSLPPIFVTITVEGQVFQVWDDVFYRSLDHADGAVSYSVVTPPIGAVLQGAPSGATEVVAGEPTLVASEGSYFLRTQRGWLVVEAPSGMNEPPIAFESPR